MYVDEIRVQLAENRPQKQVQERLREYISCSAASHSLIDIIFLFPFSRNAHLSEKKCPARDAKSQSKALFFSVLFYLSGNCSEPSRFSCKSVNHACMNEHFYMEIYLADTPHRRNAQHFGGGSEQLLLFYLYFRISIFFRQAKKTESEPATLLMQALHLVF